MKIRIVITTYNNEETINEAVEAALGQTYKNTEVMVVDDGSVDQTWERINKYLKFKNFSSIKLKNNMGVGIARNVGLLARDYDAVTFHDSDDTCDKDKIVKQVEAINEKVVVNSPIDRKMYPYISDKREVIWNSCWVEKDGERHVSGDVSFMTAQLLPNLFYANVPDKGFFHTNSGLFRKSVFDKLGGFLSIRAMEDTEMQNRILLSGFTVAYISEPLYTYRIRKNSLTYGDLNVETDQRTKLAKMVYKRIEKMRKVMGKSDNKIFKISIPNKLTGIL